ncbi:MAG: hypothetical protein GY775_13130 [Candidatus Scalindua sp.]|nr:hypothetical protein [Candidatus Scalindua sp.]
MANLTIQSRGKLSDGGKGGARWRQQPAPLPGIQTAQSGTKTRYNLGIVRPPPLEKRMGLKRTFDIMV